MPGVRQIIVVLVLVLLLTPFGVAQQKSKIKLHSPTVTGSSGLFNLPTADTFREGEFSIGMYGTHFNREAGQLDISLFPVTFTVGLTDRIEFFGSYEVYQRVHADAIAVNTVLPGHPVTPTQLPTGRTVYYNDTAFMDVGFGDGKGGSLRTGVKFNLMSERYGNGFGLAVQPVAKWAAQPADRNRLARGLTTGASDYGFDLIISKNAGLGGTVTAKGGVYYAENTAWADRQNYWTWGAGLDIPLGTPKVRAIGELLGRRFFGDRTTGLANPKSPTDLYGGLRFLPARWVSLGVAYNIYLNRIDENQFLVPAADRHGWLAHATFQRKINRPPSAVCEAAESRVIEGSTATINATVDDEDDDYLTVTWKAGAGRLTQDDTSAVFDSTGLEAGRYTVLAEVTDADGAMASCSVDIEVEKNKKPPTVSCSPSSTTIMLGESASLSASASDPNGDALTYAWSVDGSSVTNDAARFEFGSTGRSVGSHTVKVLVTDVDGMTDSCEFTVGVNRRPNVLPTVGLSLSKKDVCAGEVITATSTPKDPDGDPLTHSWQVNGQPHRGSDAVTRIDTSGMAGGSHTVTVTTKDDRGGTATASQTFTLCEKITIQVDKRVDNIAKAKLDEVALKMQQNPNLKAKLTGHTDNTGSEKANQKAGLKRAEMVKKYLVKQHNLDPERLETLSAGPSEPVADNSTAEGRKQNKRVVIELYVP